MTAHDTRILDQLRDIVGPAHVLTDPDTVAGHVIDWTGRWHGIATAVVRPADTDEVAEVLVACAHAGVGVVPQGGNTGLVGGSVPMAGEVVLSTARLTGGIHVDPVGRVLTAGAGVTVADAQRAAREHGLELGIDLASRESATLGGIVSTNAGGLRMIRYGNTRSRLLGIEAVLTDGLVLSRLTGLTKDNVGYDLPGLLAGAEGTLAVITRVMLRLSVPAQVTEVALVGVRTVADGLVLLHRLEHAGLTLEAAELMTRDGVALVGDHLQLRRPLEVDAPFLILVEVSGSSDPQQLLLSVLSGLDDLVLDAVAEPSPAARLWRYREGHTETVSAVSTTPPVKLDVSTPQERIEPFLDKLVAGLAERFPEVRPVCFGHVGDGNIHVNLMDVPPHRDTEVTDFVLRLVTEHAGSISAEHGVGRAKLPWIRLGRSDVDLAVMASVRDALDPAGVLNPALFRLP